MSEGIRRRRDLGAIVARWRQRQSAR
jgi:hypothetical protein